MYHDATIGNAINIVLVRILYLEQEEVNDIRPGSIFVSMSTYFICAELCNVTHIDFLRALVLLVKRHE